MKLIRPFQIGLNHRVLEQNKQYHFVVSASMGIDLRDGSAMLDYNFMQDAFESMGSMVRPDMGMPKPQGEYLVSGSFYSNTGEAVSGGEVAVELNGQCKRLLVFGPRRWENGIPGDAEPIVEMPLEYSKAYGGKDYPKNSDGMGYKEDVLPCIELPGRQVSSKKDSIDPAGFAPLDIAWPQRSQHQGTYDKSYLKMAYPGYPKDTSWQLFMSAPKDQWHDDFYRGDENYALYNMHPEKPCIKGQLPGLFPRCFINEKNEQAEAPEFKELPLNLDTIWFFPEREVAMLIWRGGMTVQTDEAEEISSLMLAYEASDEAVKDAEHYRKAMARRVDSDDKLLLNLKTQDLIPAAHLSAMALMLKSALEGDEDEHALKQNVDNKIASLQEEADEKINDVMQQVKAKLDDPAITDEQREQLTQQLEAVQESRNARPEKTEIEEMLESLFPGLDKNDIKQIDFSEFSFEKMEAAMQQLQQFSDVKTEETKQEVKAELDKARAQLEEQLKLTRESAQQESGDGMSELEKQLARLDDLDLDSPPEGSLPRLETAEAEQQLDQINPELLNALSQLEMSRMADSDPEQTRLLKEQIDTMQNEHLAKVKQQLQGAQENFLLGYRMGAHAMSSGLNPHSKPLDERKKDFMNAMAMKETAGKDWACLDLSGMDLSGLDLSNCLLEQVNLSNARLAGCNLRGAVLARANLQRADLSGAILDEANIGAVNAQKAIFKQCDMRDVIMSNSDFSGADFSEASLSMPQCFEVTLDNTRFCYAQIQGARFIELNISDADFSHVSFKETLFANCRLYHCDFVAADMPKTVWADCLLTELRYDKADMSSNCFTASDPETAYLLEASFEGAVLDKANFQSMLMRRSNFSSASLESANFIQADLSDSVLSKAQARAAQFRKARLTRCKLENINLMEGSLAKAHLVSAVFDGANLYAVDFLHSTMGETRFNRCNLDATIIRDWRPS